MPAFFARSKGIHAGKLLERCFCKRIPTLNYINMNHIQYPADCILFYKEMTLSTGVSHLPVKLLSAPWQGGKFEAENTQLSESWEPNPLKVDHQKGILDTSTSCKTQLLQGLFLPPTESGSFSGGRWNLTMEDESCCGDGL